MRPAGGNRADRPTVKGIKRAGVGLNKRVRLGVAATGLALGLAIALGATGVLTPMSQHTALGASTTLTVISGIVTVRHGNGDFGPVDDGSVLGPTDTVRTGADARAVLTYFEGSTVEIEPNSELTIDQAHANPNGSTIILMTQTVGQTWHVVTHLVNSDSRYEVHTTAATASVRGTAFQVGVEPDGTTTEVTTEGAVANSDRQSVTTVVTPPGQQTTTKKGEAPEPPKPAPAPDRKVTVTVSDQNALVVDALGRANGIRDGKEIRQTPGAQLSIVNGHLVVTLPNVPDGTIATHFQRTSTSETEVRTRVEDKGKAPVEVTDTVRAGSNSGVDVKKGTGDRPSVEKKQDKKDLPSPKVGQAPRPTEEPKKSDDPNANDRNGSGTSRETNPAETPRGFAPAFQLPPIPGSAQGANRNNTHRSEPTPKS